MNGFKKYHVVITDGDLIDNRWTVEARDKYEALCLVLMSWKDYGIPYGIEKSGIVNVTAFEY